VLEQPHFNVAVKPMPAGHDDDLADCAWFILPVSGFLSCCVPVRFAVWAFGGHVVPAVVAFGIGSVGEHQVSGNFLVRHHYFHSITAQCGLNGDKDDIHRFRLVLVNEAFGKTDEENSKRALELFKELDLQLVVINPFDAKSRIVEDYVD
jgi:hypothetical protein